MKWNLEAMTYCKFITHSRSSIVLIQQVNNTLVWKMVEALGAHGEEFINFMKYSVIMEDTILVMWACERIIQVLTLWCQN